MNEAASQVVVVGAGPAGLATSFALYQKGITHLVLEQGDQVGNSWAHLYDNLTLHTGKHLSALPGMPLPPGTPLFPSRQKFLAYLHQYAQEFKLPIRTGCDVKRVQRNGEGWCIKSSQGDFFSRSVVLATGIVSNQVIPSFQGQGRYHGDLQHSVEYKNPKRYAGRQVLVIGVGNSGAEIANELAAGGVSVTLAIRTGAHVVPLKVFGVPIQYYSVMLEKLPSSVRGLITKMFGAITELFFGESPVPKPPWTVLEKPPVIGRKLIEQIRKGKIRVKRNIVEFTETGATFDDGTVLQFDHVILATGYRAALGPIQHLIQLDARGFALRNQVVSLDQPDLYFVGHNYSSVGALLNIRRDAKLVATMIAQRLSH